MFVSIFFNIHYESDCYHWYLDTLNYAHQYGYPLITSEEYNLVPYATNTLVLNSDFPRRHELERNITESEREEVEQYFVPLELLKGNQRNKEAWTEIMLRLIEERSAKLEDFLDGILHEILVKHPGERFEGFLFFGESYESVRRLADKYQCPVITYELSAIRTDVAYTQTLICANMLGRQFGSTEGKTRYEKFISEAQDVPWFTHRELIAMFGKESTLPLLPLLGIEPQYEIGVCGYGQCIVQPLFAGKKYTDDDLKAECAALYPQEKRLWRQHLGFLSYTEVLESRIDPEFFILSCRRVAAVGSNILTEAMLWNRTACCRTNLTTFSFLCEEDLSSENKVTELALNYLFFGLLVPGYSSLFDPDYWRWRLSGPTETEIYQRHMQICLKKAGLDGSISELNGEVRLGKIMNSRGCNPAQIEQAIAPFNQAYTKHIDFQFLLSYAEISYTDGNENLITKQYWCRNRFENGIILSEFLVENLEKDAKIRFLPLLDIGGFVCPTGAILNGKDIPLEGYTRWQAGEWYDYLPKYGLNGYTAILHDCNSERSTLVLAWKYKELGEGRYYELSSSGKEQRTAENALEAANSNLQTTQAHLNTTEGELRTTREKLNNTEFDLREAHEQLNCMAVKLNSTVAELNSTQMRLANTESSLQSANTFARNMSDTVCMYEERLQESDEKLYMTEANLTATKAALDTIENAAFWKITKPLRTALDYLKRLF